jgi:(E)-4-hydroxy-3-methylbut-2-enyl-diphosphate synthase
MYTNSLTKYSRRKTNSVRVGNITIGSDSDIALQTMTNTPTSDIAATAKQVVKAYEAGAQIVRITAPSMRDVEHIAQIRENIVAQNYTIPLVADIHFNQKIAFEAAKIVDKVRINPGNFADSKKFEKLKYTPEEYKEELKRIREAFLPLIELCKTNKTTLRIGTNHGSLSDRIMSRFGDTAEGMAESAMEFLRICKEASFDQVIISMKASNTRIMVHATRLLVEKMKKEDIPYPLHLGVTEAGEGEDGRIKSAVGIGTLLVDGIGDTIRVSLTEPPEDEIPVAKKIVDLIQGISNHENIEDFGNYPIDFSTYSRRKTNEVLNIGGNHVPVVIGNSKTREGTMSPVPDYFSDGNYIHSTNGLSKFREMPENKALKSPPGDDIEFIHISCSKLSNHFLGDIHTWENKILVLKSDNKNIFADFRAAIFRLINAGISLPVIIKRTYALENVEDFQIQASVELGGLFIDGLADGIWIENEGTITDDIVLSTALGILQACRMRMTKPDYTSCPSCGRTMFNLQQTTQKIRERTSHLTGLKIGIMGCIVNGLGEMADADYGYIGSGPGKVNLYFNKDLIKKGIKEELAVDELVNLIKEKGDWKEP